MGRRRGGFLPKSRVDSSSSQWWNSFSGVLPLKETSTCVSSLLWPSKAGSAMSVLNQKYSFGKRSSILKKSA